jgi:cobyrinic acid a,c-diamide synthase
LGAPLVVVAAPRTGSGKTVVTLALLRALRRRGLAVAAAKVGPDFIDPAFHAAATGRATANLDPWGMRLATLAATLDRTAADADLVVVEGVMGLFDAAADGTGSTADLAALLDVPVVLVVDAAGQGASVAAVVEGFARFRDDVEIGAIVLNRVAGERHARLLTDALDARVSTPVLGWLPVDPRLALPTRHLGLVQAVEHPGLDAFLDAAADLVAQRLDLDRVERIARAPTLSALGPAAPALPPPGARIALAQDAAFAFAYPHVLDGWRAAGATILPFAPLDGAASDATADAVMLPGGYPELHAERLAGAATFLNGLRRAATRGAAIYGECGGYMVLGRSLVDAAGRAHAMAGLLPVATSFAASRRQLGLRQVTLLAGGPLGPAGTRYRGHEFHYAAETARDGPALLDVQDARGEPLGAAGCRAGTVAGSFVHLVDRADARTLASGPAGR